MNLSAYAFLLSATLFWGGNAVAGKLAVGHISPMTLSSLRWLFAFAVIAAIGWPTLKADWPAVRRNLTFLVFLGFLGFTIFNVALYTALVYTSAINVSIEQAGIAPTILLLNFLLHRTGASPAQLAGVAVSTVGIALTASHGDPARLLRLDVNAGDAIMLVGVVAYGAYSVLLRRKPAIHWQSTMLALTAAGFLTSLPFAAGEFALGADVVPDAEGWLILAYVVIFPSIASQIFYIRGVEMIGANRAGLFVNMVPIFGTMLSILLLGEAFQTYHALALALVLCGIWLAESRSRNA